MITIAFIATSLSGVMQAANTVYGCIHGPVFGTFLLGILIPHCTKKGAIAGVTSAIVSKNYYPHSI